jgi:filamentous hemagglutinin
VGVSICVPPFCLGQVAVVNMSAAKANINSDYQSVTEQSGLKAGDGGFTVNVQGNTDLKGAAITSTQAAIDNNKNTFTTGGTLPQPFASRYRRRVQCGCLHVPEWQRPQD